MTFTSELIMNDWEKLYFNFQGGQHNSYNSTHIPKEIFDREHHKNINAVMYTVLAALCL